MDGELESVLVIWLPHGFEAAGHSFGVAVLAPGADLGAPGDGIPGGFGPFYGGLYRDQPTSKTEFYSGRAARF